MVRKRAGLATSGDGGHTEQAPTRSAKAQGKTLRKGAAVVMCDRGRPYSTRMNG